MKYGSSYLPSSGGANTGVALMYLPVLSKRPMVIVSAGRHEIATCYMQFPIGNKDYSSIIPIVSGGFSAISVSGELALFAGDSGVSSVTPSSIFRICPDTQSAVLVWTDTEDIIVRNGAFVKDSNDIVLVGCRKDTNCQYASAVYYSCVTSSSGSLNWQVKWKNDVCGHKAFAVGVSSSNGVTAIGNRICIKKYREQQCEPMTSCILREYQSSCTAAPEVEEYYTSMQAVGCCVAHIIPNKDMIPDIVMVGSGHRGLRSQCFLIKGDTNERLDIGPLTDGRAVSTFDFTGNGLLDIFIVSVSDPHVLLVQHQPGIFETILVNNVTALQGGEARGLAIGRLYSCESEEDSKQVNVIVTDASGVVPNVIYSFND